MREANGTSDMRYLIRNARIVKATCVLQGDICIEGGVISSISEPLKDDSDYTVIDAGGQYVIPGFIDIHLHGGIGFDLTAGRYDAERGDFDPSLENYQNHIKDVMLHLAREGTTLSLLATVAAPLERLEQVMGEVASYIENHPNGNGGCRLLGAFVEGSFIKHPANAGAQNPEYFHEPDIALFKRLQNAAGGNIRYVNVVPEYGDAAIALIEYLTENGVLVGAGHTSCSAEVYSRAVDKGLRVAIHFTNGPTGSSFKPFGGGNVLQAVLPSRKVFAELIGDGCHVNPAYLMDILHRKGSDRIIAVTDAMFLTGLSEVSEFTAYGIRGVVSDDRRYVRVAEKENTLFGSMHTMSVAFANWISWFTREMKGVWTNKYLPMDLDEAVRIATHLCSANPAKVLDLSGHTGTLSAGKRADIVLLKLDGEPGDYRVNVSDVFVGGRRV